MGRLADAENAAAKGGKAAMAKLENKIRELEAELAGTQARTGEAGKAYQRAERKCKELVFSSGEDKKNQDRMTDLASKLQSKIKTYKQQIEEAEEIAALNLAKFRKAQQELEEVEERAKLAALLYFEQIDRQIRSVEFGKKSDRFCKNYWTSQSLRLQKLPGLNSRTPSPHIKLLPPFPTPLSGCAWLILMCSAAALVSKLLYSQIE